MQTVDLIRHAESRINVAMADPNTVPFIGGRQNHVDLSPVGENQAKSLGTYAIENSILPSQLFCSPAVRSQRTCQLSAEVMGLVIAPTIDDRLQELDQGEWTNQPRTIYDDPVIKAKMKETGSDFAAPNGESINDVADRMESFFGSLNDVEYAWVHTHGVAIKSWLGRLCGWNHERTYKTAIDNVSISRVVKQGNVWVPQFINKSSKPLSSPATG